jgi:hypothetical protein
MGWDGMGWDGMGCDVVYRELVVGRTTRRVLNAPDENPLLWMVNPLALERWVKRRRQACTAMNDV